MLDALRIQNQRRKRYKIKLIMIGQYIDDCIRVLITVAFADLLLRMYKIGREFFLYKNYYRREKRLINIVQRCLDYSNATKIFFGCFILLALIRTSMGPTSAIGGTQSMSLLPPLHYLSFIPMYWLIYAIGFFRSTLDYADWIRGDSGLDYAQGMASNYFHGYLKLTLPSHTADTGIKERMELYEAKNDVKFALNRLIILVPNTMFVNSTFESKILERVAPLETVMINRAGVKRPFKNDVFRFTEPINNTFYYVAMEGATPMLSFFESLNFQLTTSWQMKEMQREILLKFYKYLKKLCMEWPETNQEIEIILYNAHKTDGRLQDVGEVVLAHLTNLWKEGKTH